MKPHGDPESDCRCLCGSLLARWSDQGVELKCRRCKRTVLVPLPPGAERHWRSVRRTDEIPPGPETRT